MSRFLWTIWTIAMGFTVVALPLLLAALGLGNLAVFVIWVVCLVALMIPAWRLL